MVRIQEIDKLKYGCSLCFTDIVLRKENSWIINHDENLHEASARVSQREVFPMHKACWRILEACWDTSLATTPIDLDILADFFLSQPRGWHLPHFLEGNWVDRSFELFDEYTRYRDPDDYTPFEDAMHRFAGFQSIDRLVTGVQDFTSMEWSDRFSSLPTELRLAVLCFLPSLSVEAVKDASQSMAAVPLKVTYWLSRLSEPKFCHLPASYLKKYGHRLGQQWARILLDEQLGKTNRYRVIRYNEALVSKMLQRKAYLASLPTDMPKSTYCKLVASPDEPHTIYQKSEKTVTWQSTIVFEPDVRINAVTASYVRSWSGQSLSGFTFFTEDRNLKLGYTDTNDKRNLDFGPESGSPRRVDLQTDSRGIFSVIQVEKIPFARTPYTIDKATLNVDTLTRSAGMVAELTLDNRIIKIGLLAGPDISE
ncbi:MAG: hypothetical protein Q9167_005071 [Letrouitia subvulpina]